LQYTPDEKCEGTWHVQPEEKIGLGETQQPASNIYEEVTKTTAPGSSHWRVAEEKTMAKS